MKCCVAYVAVCNGPLTTDYCARFVTTWNQFPPGIETDLIVICNGGPLTTEQTVLFSGLNARFWPRVNDGGYDISAYLEASRGICADYDMLLCCGESIYFHREGWLKRFSESRQKHGPGFYGAFSSNLVRPHINTTGFCCHPEILRRYPKKVMNRGDRYNFEHGTASIWRQTASQAMPVKLVTWDGEYAPNAWRVPRNILWRGTQENCLMKCSHTDRFDKMDSATKARWARGADQPFR